MSNIIEAGIKEKINNSNSDLSFYKTLLTLVNDDTKYNVIDPKEELSYILEFKVFYLLSIFAFKNEKAKDYLFGNLDLKEFLIKKSLSYAYSLNDYIQIIKSKKIYSVQKLSMLTKAISKFYEFIYNIIIKDDKRIEIIKTDCSKVVMLLKLINSNREDLSIGKEFDVFMWMERLLREHNEDG